MGFPEAAQAEDALDGPARPDRYYAAVWRLVGALKPRIPDGLCAGNATGIIGDLSPAPAVLVFSQQQGGHSLKVGSE
jgi:hypothetical protein